MTTNYPVYEASEAIHAVTLPTGRSVSRVNSSVLAKELADRDLLIPTPTVIHSEAELKRMNLHPETLIIHGTVADSRPWPVGLYLKWGGGRYPVAVVASAHQNNAARAAVQAVQEHPHG